MLKRNWVFFFVFEQNCFGESFVVFCSFYDFVVLGGGGFFFFSFCCVRQRYLVSILLFDTKSFLQSYVSFLFFWVFIRFQVFDFIVCIYLFEYQLDFCYLFVFCMYCGMILYVFTSIVFFFWFSVGFFLKGRGSLYRLIMVLELDFFRGIFGFIFSVV